jgi:undecaprenyl pyrophosphate phosphatase UppP
VPGLALGVGWLAYRTPGWAVFGGSINPTHAQIPGTLARHALAIIPAVIVGLAFHKDPGLSLVMGAVFAVAATGLAVWYSGQVAKGKPSANTYVELARGAVFGVTMGIALIGG